MSLFSLLLAEIMEGRLQTRSHGQSDESTTYDICGVVNSDVDPAVADGCRETEQR